MDTPRSLASMLTLIPLLCLPLGCRTQTTARLTEQLQTERRGGAVDHFNDLKPSEDPGRPAFGGDDVVTDESDFVDGEPVDVDISDDVVVDDLGDEGAIADEVAISQDTEAGIVDADVGATGERTDCGLSVMATSPGAVGDPCLTNDQFMDTLDLTNQQREYVRQRASMPAIPQQP